MTLVFCDDCEHVHPASRVDTKPWRYRCMMAPTRSGYAFVHPLYSPDPPYQLCERVNFDGKCPEFEPRRIHTEDAAS
jgi:hypothetical protein